MSFPCPWTSIKIKGVKIKVKNKTMIIQKYSENSRKDNNIPNLLTTVLFIIYLVALFWILLFKLGVHFSNMGKINSINLIPFSKPSMSNGRTDFSEMILNVMIFVPIGLYVGILFKKWNFVKKLFVFFFGKSEYILRFFPFVCGVASICLFYGIAKNYLSQTELNYLNRIV